MRTILWSVSILTAIGLLVGCSNTVVGPIQAQKVLVSKPYSIDRIYESMTGPASTESRVSLIEHAGRPEMLWLTSVRAEVLDAKNQTGVSPDFFCHSNLLFSGGRRRHESANEFTRVPDGRLVTLIPGRLDVSLPVGFGIPLYSDELLDHFTMALNLNGAKAASEVLFRTTINFERNVESVPGNRKRPLFRRAIYGHESTKAENVGDDSSHAHHSGDGKTLRAATLWRVPRTADDSKTIHWLVGPGLIQSTVGITPQLELQEETRIHCIWLPGQLTEALAG